MSLAGRRRQPAAITSTQAFRPTKDVTLPTTTKRSPHIFLRLARQRLSAGWNRLAAVFRDLCRSQLVKIQGSKSVVQMIRRMTHLGLSRAFAMWSARVATQTASARSIKRICTKAANRRLVMGWQSWTSAVRSARRAASNQAQGMAMVQRVTRRLQNQFLSSSFDSWTAAVGAMRRAERRAAECDVKVNKVLGRLMNQRKSKVWSTWRELVMASKALKEGRTRQSQLLKRTIARLQRRQKAHSWNCWHASCQRHRLSALVRQ